MVGPPDAPGGSSGEQRTTSSHPYSKVVGRRDYQFKPLTPAAHQLNPEITEAGGSGGSSSKIEPSAAAQEEQSGERGGEGRPLLEEDEAGQRGTARLSTFHSFGKKSGSQKELIGPTSLRSISMQRQRSKRLRSFSLGRTLSRLSSIGRQPAAQTGEEGGEAEEDDDEEHLCRICLGELVTEAKEGEPEPLTVLKLECACKGEIGMVHKECGYTWFKYKANRTCDVCGQEVENIPVEILSRQSTMQRQGRLQEQPPEPPPPAQILVVCLIYLITFNNVLMDAEVEAPVVHALPLAMGGGLFTLLITHFTVTEGNIWNYMLLQVSMVVGGTLFLYSGVRLDAQLSCLLGLLLGLGVAAVLCAFVTLDLLRQHPLGVWQPVPASQRANAGERSVTDTLTEVRTVIERESTADGVVAPTRPYLTELELQRVEGGEENSRSPRGGSNTELSPRRRRLGSPSARDIETGGRR